MNDFAIEKTALDFPSGTVDKNLSANSGDTGSTCQGATKLVGHNYGARALEPVSCSYRSQVLQVLKPTHLKPVHCDKEEPQLATIRESPHKTKRTPHSQKIK